MKKIINLYLASEIEYRRGLANMLINEGVVDFCLTDHLPWTDQPDHDERIVTVDHNPSADAEYDTVCDIDSLPAISADLMIKMLPYESMAIKMGMRRFSYPTTEYEEEKRKYLQHLRYWNYMFDKYGINLIVTHNIPHSQGKFVIYGLARVRGIPMLIWHRSGLLDERCFWGRDLSDIGSNIGKKYDEIMKMDVKGVFLDDDIKRAYESCIQGENDFISKEHRKIKNDLTSIYENSYKNMRNDLVKQFFMTIIKSLYKKGDLSLYKKRAPEFRRCKRQLRARNYYKRHLCYGVNAYNKMTSEVDYSKKYIIFFLQIYPEASTLPLAGEFAEQYNSIQLLARIAEGFDIDVYIKEHPRSVYRSKDFYDDLSRIKNVRFINTFESTDKLIRNSVAVATQTGTCILESVAKKIPVLVFGRGYFWKNCPGLFEVRSEEQGRGILEIILSDKIIINDDDVIRYFYAIQTESIHGENAVEQRKRVLNDNYGTKPYYEEERVELIKSFISEEC